MNYAPGIQDQAGSLLLRGYESAADSTVQGGLALGRGISAGIQGVGKGIEKYMANKEEAEAITPLGDYYFGTDPEKHAKFVAAGLSAKKGMIGAAVAEEAAGKRNFGMWQAEDESQRSWHGLTTADERAREQMKLRGTFETSQPPGLGGSTLLTNPGTGAFDVLTPKPAEPVARPDQPPLLSPDRKFYYDDKAQQWKPHTDADAGAPKLVQGDVEFETNRKVALKQLDELQAVIEKHGTWESAYLGDADSAAKLKAIPYTLAIATAKIVDPASVAREGEVEAAKKYTLPTGYLANKKSALAAIEHHRSLIDSYATGRTEAKAAPAPGGAAPSTQAPAGMGGYLPRRKYGGKTYLGGDPNQPQNWR